MPFKSEAQHRKFRVLLEQGKISQSKLDEWMDETRKKAKDKDHPIKGLPERVKKAFLKVADIIPGGKADDADDSEFDKDQIEKGKKVEKEHTKDPALAKEIAKDHLKENSRYYDHLKDMEEKMASYFSELGKVARCWDGYKPVKGKKPFSKGSCEPIEKKAEVEEKKPLYQPKPSTRPGKKYQVYVKGDSGNPKLIHFGATGYKHNYSEGAKKNFRARHNCDSASKDTPRWWACNYLWNKKQDIGQKTYEKAAGMTFTPQEEKEFFAGFLKAAGGPGSGVSGDNTAIIDCLESSPIISIGKRKSFMEDHKPMFEGKQVPVNKIKYKCQEKYVPKKYNRMLESAKKDNSLFEKPVKLLLDDQGDYHVIDGHHRALAAIELKKDTIKADVYVINGGEKKVASLHRSFLKAFGSTLKKEMDNPNMLSVWGYLEPSPGADKRLELINQNKSDGKPESFQ